MSLMSTTPLPPVLVHAMRNTSVTAVTDMKVLLWACTSLTDTQFKPVRSWFVANLIGVDDSSVNRSLQHLAELGYIERGSRGGNGNFEYRLAFSDKGDHSPPPLQGAA